MIKRNAHDSDKQSATIEWSTYAAIISSFMELLVENGNGTNEDNADCLNYFYSPYVKKNEDNKKPMKVTVKDGGLTFEGFDIAPEE